MRPSSPWRSQSGITLVELLVTAFVLVVGLLGVLTMLTNAVRTTAANNERVGATNLARELVEAARSVSYNSLTATDMTAALQALPNMGSGSPWVIRRRGISYTVTPNACVFDDPIDKLETPARADLCAGGPAGTTGDRNGDDFRRVSFRIQWIDRGLKRKVDQTSLIVNPSGGLGPRILSFTPTVTPVTSGSTATFTVTTQRAAAVNWSTDDGASSGVATGGPTTWSITWQLGTVGAAGSVVDGSYRVIAQAFDLLSVPGDSKVASVTINRTAPLALQNFVGGHNDRLDVVDMLWKPTIERDILGYRVYHAGGDKARGGGDDTQVCPATPGMLSTTTLSCSTPFSGSASVYYIVAVDRSPAGAEREGTESELLLVTHAGTTPAAPTTPFTAVTNSDSLPELSWGASPTTPLAMYRVYRNGAALADRIGLSDGTTTQYTDDAATAAGSYYVTAVDSTFNESAPIGPVSWP